MPVEITCGAVLTDDCVCAVSHERGQKCEHTQGWHDEGLADHEFIPEIV